MDAVAGEPSLEFLISRERKGADVGDDHADAGNAADEDRAGAGIERLDAVARRCSGDEPAVTQDAEVL